MWESTGQNPILPPKYKQPGRPKRLRKRAVDEPQSPPTSGPQRMTKKGVVMTCSLCHQAGHNWLGCKGQCGPKPDANEK